MAFRKKAEFILKFNPDVLIIQECEHPEKLNFDYGIPIPNDMFWFGNNLNKGLGIFSYNEFRIKAMRNQNQELKWIIPIYINRNNEKYNLFAIWANNPEDKDGQYVEQVWKGIHHYHKRIKNDRTILIGDFNSNTIWDRKRRAGNHSNVVKKLQEKGIQSCYHLHSDQIQGKEKDPTFYLYKHLDKPYHLDYCFASADLTKKLKMVEIGSFENWMKHSDHVPVMIKFEI